MGWRQSQIRGYLCQLLFCADAIALAVLAVSICRTVLIWSGLDIHIFYLGSLDSSQMLPFFQLDLFFTLCLAAYIFKNLYKHSHPPKLAGRFKSSCRATSSSALSIGKLNAKGLGQVEGCWSQNWTGIWDVVTPEPSTGAQSLPQSCTQQGSVGLLGHLSKMYVICFATERKWGQNLHQHGLGESGWKKSRFKPQPYHSIVVWS